MILFPLRFIKNYGAKNDLRPKESIKLKNGHVEHDTILKGWASLQIKAQFASENYAMNVVNSLLVYELLAKLLAAVS